MEQTRRGDLVLMLVAALVLAITLASCATHSAPPPGPTPAPAPTPPSPVCHAGDTCGCWVEPPGLGWQQLPACGVTPPQPAPTPTPDVSGACPFAPCPLREWTAAALPAGWAPALVGHPAVKINSHPYSGRWFDTTPVTQRDLAYCQSIGYNDGRDQCPARMDGDPQRRPIEDWWLYGGPRREGRYPETPTSCGTGTDNPYMGMAGTGNCRICSQRSPALCKKTNDDGSQNADCVCSEWY